MSGYADDLKLLAASVDDLQLIFKEVQSFLSHLGLSITDKCSVLSVGGTNQSFMLGSLRIKPVSEFKFLGLKITNQGHFLPWRDDFQKGMHSVKGALARVGLGNLPLALVKGLLLRTVPALLYGCEIWCCHWLVSVLKGDSSPYIHPRLNIVLDFMKAFFGLPKNSFTAVIFKLTSFPSMLALVLPRMMKFISAISSGQWNVI